MRTPGRCAATGIIWLCCLLLAGCADNRIQLPRLSADAVILAFGDSLTFGTGAERTESYPAVLGNLSGHTVINAGVPGEVTATGVERLPALLERHQPELLILCHGGNDLLRKMSNLTTRSNIEAMITMASERGIPTLLIGVPQPALLFLESAGLYDDIAEKYGLVYASEILPRVEANNDLKSDRIHPNASGYKLLAEAIHALMQESGAL